LTQNIQIDNYLINTSALIKTLIATTPVGALANQNTTKNNI